MEKYRRKKGYLVKEMDQNELMSKKAQKDI